MPEQLIFTSTPTGIVPGRSGFQVVAQHNSINSRLVSALEKESVYEFADTSQSLPIICKHLKFDYGDERYSVLTKIQPCGVDFTGRPNHIAHHLIFTEKNLPKCPPAALFALWKGWRNKWTNAPRYFGGWDKVNYENTEQPFYYPKFSLPSRTWKTYVGDEGAAALPILAKQPICFNTPDGKEDALVWLFFESQSLLDPESAWGIQFTNFLMETDNPNRYRWFGRQQSNSIANLGMDLQTMDVFSGKNDAWNIPDHPLVHKARSHAEGEEPAGKKRKKTPVSIAPLEDSKYVQDEFVLEKKILLEGEKGGNLPVKHPHENFDDIFKSDDDGVPVEIPDFSLQDESTIEIQKPSLLKRVLPFIYVGTFVLIGAGLVLVGPSLVESLNKKTDPSKELVDFEQEKAKKLEVLNVDPETRFADQLGEADSIIQNGQFLLARAYLARNRSNPEKVTSEGFKKIDQWFEEQKSTLEMVNRETGLLGKQVAQKMVISDFDRRRKSILRGIENLASDLQPSVAGSLKVVTDEYQSWLDEVRLKTEDVPTFFVPVSFENPNPEIAFTELPQAVAEWFQALESISITTQIESIQIKLSPFQGLNQFQLTEDSALNLTLWKKDERSLISYLDGQTEILGIETDSKTPKQIKLTWLYRPSDNQTQTKSEGRFPEPPLILNFRNTLNDSGINIVVTGGVSESSIQPAELPVHFLRFRPKEYKLEVRDPVVRKKLHNFILPPGNFLRLKSLDERFHFGWDMNSSDFHIYESRDLDSPEVLDIQAAIAQKHKRLSVLERTKVVYESVDFVRNTPLWSLGTELLPSKSRPAYFEDFGQFYASKPSRFVDYIHDIFIHFSTEFTLVSPEMMEKWIEYPRGQHPETAEDIAAYSDLLLRTSKRFSNFLRKDDPNVVEYWRLFVTNLEFWLLGEHREKLVDILSLTESEMELAKNTDIGQVDREIASVRENILSLQSSLDSRSDLEEIGDIDMWLMEMTSLEATSSRLPLILFK